jgi:hypothetical protein
MHARCRQQESLQLGTDHLECSNAEAQQFALQGPLFATYCTHRRVIVLPAVILATETRASLCLTHQILTPATAAATPPPLQDIVESQNAFTIHADAPGFTPDDISVEMNEGTLTISGKRKEEKQEEREGKVREATACEDASL